MILILYICHAKYQKIMANKYKYIIEQLKNEFKDRVSFSRNELFAFYKRFEPELNDNTFRWRIFVLNRTKMMTTLSSDLFTLKYKKRFTPKIGDHEWRIHKVLRKRFPGLGQCIWSTKVLNEFMLHIPGKFDTILEVEKTAIEPVYEYLKEQKIGNIFIQPEENELERYVFESKNAIILIPLITKSPLQEVNHVNTITIEKMIVDLYCDKKLFNAYQGNELIHIINNAYNSYSISFTKLFSYAGRRGNREALQKYLDENTNIPKKLLND